MKKAPIPTGDIPETDVTFPEQMTHSSQEEIGLPCLFKRTHEIPDVHDIAWPKRLSIQLHAGFIRRSASFPVVAGHTCSHQVGPRVLAPARSGHDVVYGDPIRRSAILATVSIPPDDVFPGQEDSFVRDADIGFQTYNAGPGKLSTGTANDLLPLGLYHFGFLHQYENNGPLHARYGQGLIILIQNQDVSGQGTLRTRCGRTGICSGMFSHRSAPHGPRSGPDAIELERWLGKQHLVWFQANSCWAHAAFRCFPDI